MMLSFRSLRRAFSSSLVSSSDLATRILSGDRIALSRGITLLESTRADHHDLIQDTLSRILDHQHAHPRNIPTLRVGISGPPGAGKSTLIEALGTHVCSLPHQPHKVAVLAVDPSSTVHGGSILGDKTRMTELSRHPNAYVRPSPTRGVLGGVTATTYEAMLLCEAAGFDVLFVETVGVGQSETVIAELADMLALVVYPGGGDELQGIKKGIVEVADMIIVNKADGENAARAEGAKAEYASALQLLRTHAAVWQPPVVTCSAFVPGTIPAVWDTMEQFKRTVVACGAFEQRRAKTRMNWLRKQVRDELFSMLMSHAGVKETLRAATEDVIAERITPRLAAQKVISAYSASTKAPEECKA
jgi:LAO/AO transport system kinase